MGGLTRPSNVARKRDISKILFVALGGRLALRYARWPAMGSYQDSRGCGTPR